MPTAGIYCAARRWRKNGHGESGRRSLKQPFARVWNAGSDSQRIMVRRSLRTLWPGLSRLAVWWIKLGIVPERIAAGHPEQNGRHERMHRTLKQEAGTAAGGQPPASSNRSCIAFARNTTKWRPHEALGMQTPARCVSAVSEKTIRRGCRNRNTQRPCWWRSVPLGRVFFVGKSNDVFLTEVLWGENVGAIAGGRSLVHDLLRTTSFGTFFDSQKLCVTPLPKNAQPSHRRCRGRGLAPFPGSSSTPPGGFQCVSHPPGLKMSTIRPARTPFVASEERAVKSGQGQAQPLQEYGNWKGQKPAAFTTPNAPPLTYAFKLNGSWAQPAAPGIQC